MKNLSLVLLVGLCACYKQDFQKQIINPYTVESMQRAYDSLCIKNNLPSKELEASHYYVKFEEDFKDSSLILFDYPLIGPNEGKLDGNVYAVINTDYQGDYIILSELYLPNQIELESKSLQLCGYNDTHLKASSWRPQGTIKVFDDNSLINDYIPVVGVKVRARRWFKVKEALTDRNGYFIIEKFKRPVNYSVKWEGEDYDIRKERLGQAYTNGPKQRSRWDLKIDEGFDRGYAIAHIAVNDYYSNSYRIQTPPKNKWYGRKLKIGVFEGDVNNSGDAGYSTPWNRWWHTGHPDIKIGDLGQRFEVVYARVIHELAHAAHWEICDNKWEFTFKVEEIVKESWADGVMWYFTSQRSGSYSNDWFQKKTYESIPYTTVVIDMIDDINQKEIFGNNYIDDRVSGFTLHQIENTLLETHTFHEWKNKLSNVDNPTANYIGLLFGYWVR